MSRLKWDLIVRMEADYERSCSHVLQLRAMIMWVDADNTPDLDLSVPHASRYRAALTSVCTSVVSIIWNFCPERKIGSSYFRQYQKGGPCEVGNS